jgi:glycine cleavage system H protein
MSAQPSTRADEILVAGFPVRTDRHYDPASHLWVLPLPDGVVRVGMDSLNVETTGTLAGLDFLPEGTELRRGTPYGTVEAAKFVGPLATPLTSVLVRGNPAVLVDPGLIEREPYDDGWLVELRPTDWDGESPMLLSGVPELETWMAAEVADYRERGLIAE